MYDNVWFDSFEASVIRNSTIQKELEELGWVLIKRKGPTGDYISDAPYQLVRHNKDRGGLLSKLRRLV